MLHKNIASASGAKPKQLENIFYLRIKIIYIPAIAQVDSPFTRVRYLYSLLHYLQSPSSVDTLRFYSYGLCSSCTQQSLRYIRLQVLVLFLILILLHFKYKLYFFIQTESRVAEIKSFILFSGRTF